MAGTGKIIGVSHTGLTTSDIERSIVFFRDILGFPVDEPVLYEDSMFERVTGVKGANIRISYVKLPGHTLELLEYVKPLDKKASELRPCDPGHIHLSLLVENIEDLVEKIREGGFETVGPIQHVGGDEPFKVIYAHGPDRLYLELMDYS